MKQATLWSITWEDRNAFGGFTNETAKIVAVSLADAAVLFTQQWGNKTVKDIHSLGDIYVGV